MTIFYAGYEKACLEWNLQQQLENLKDAAGDGRDALVKGSKGGWRGGWGTRGKGTYVSTLEVVVEGEWQTDLGNWYLCLKTPYMSLMGGAWGSLLKEKGGWS